MKFLIKQTLSLYVKLLMCTALEKTIDVFY